MSPPATRPVQPDLRPTQGADAALRALVRSLARQAAQQAMAAALAANQEPAHAQALAAPDGG
jgi:hypothetical protein